MKAQRRSIERLTFLFLQKLETASDGMNKSDLVRSMDVNNILAGEILATLRSRRAVRVETPKWGGKWFITPEGRDSLKHLRLSGVFK